MLNSLYLKDFKSYGESTLNLTPVTVMIGANASGKSNALEALRFLSWLAQGQKLSTLQYLVNDNDRVVRGKIEDLPRAGQSSFVLGCTLKEMDFDRLEIKLEIRGNELHIREESVTQSKEGYFLYRIKNSSQGKQNIIGIEYNNFARGGKKPVIDGSDQMSVFTQLSSAARFKDGHKKARQIIPIVTAAFEESLKRILFLDPVPQKMRGYSFESDQELKGNGVNLSSTLFSLINKEKKNKERILDFVCSLPEQNLLDIDFLRGPRKELLVQVIEQFGKTKQTYDASLLSDGTLRVLAYAAALLSAPEGSMVIIEELDNGVHPSRVGQLLNSIYTVAKERSLSVLITSHNPALLDALPDEVVPDVVFCYRDKQSGNSKLTSLKNIARYPELLGQGSLGELLTRGLVDKYAKNQQTVRERTQEALSWLKSVG